MRSRAFCASLLLAIFPPLDAPYRLALPGYRYEFPRDFFAHPEFQTEWWYATGNVKTAVSQKAEGAGRASHYFSQTRLATTGTIVLQGQHFVVSGLSWMDHEFFTHQLAAGQTGWDWFSIQLEDKTELMLFILRRKDASIDPFSAGTYVDAAGKTTHLRANEFSLTPTGTTWKSAQTGASYPIAWNITVRKMAIALSAGTKLPQQEFAATSKLAPGYWEGSMD